MFSGIIERIGSIQGVEVKQSARCLAVMTGFTGLASGESVAVNGVCLTVAGYNLGSAVFWLSQETLVRSNLGHLRPGNTVNLERPVTPKTRLSGHIVQGHVDGIARLISIQNHDGGHQLELSLPDTLRPYCVEKGSIAIDGISLTLNQVGAPGDDARFPISLNIIPYTWNHTTLRFINKESRLNVEVDILAKYVEQLCPISLRQSRV